MSEYSEYMFLKSRVRQTYDVTELPLDTIAAINQAKMSDAHDDLDNLME